MSALSAFTRLKGMLMLGPRGEIGYVTDQKTFQIDPTLTSSFATYTVRFLSEYLANLDDHLFRIGLLYPSRQQKPWGAETLLLTDAVVRMLYPLSGARQGELTTFQQKKRENSVFYGMELLLEYALKDSPGVPIFLPIVFDRGTTLSQYPSFPSDLRPNEEPGTPTLELLNLIGPAAASRANVDAFVALKNRLHETFVKKDGRKSIEMKIMEGMRASGAGAATPASAPPAAGAPATRALNTDTTSAQWYSPTLHDVTCEKLQRFLTQPREYAEVEQIRNLVRFRELGPAHQKDLATRCPVYAAPPNSTLLERGTADQWNLYLLQGDLQLTAEDGERKLVSGGTDNARNAIATLKPRKFTVMALTRARFLWIHESIIAEIQQRQPGSSLELMP